jgi:hypothetical protein
MVRRTLSVRMVNFERFLILPNLFFRTSQASVAMRIGAGQTSAQFTLFAGLRSTGRAANGQSLSFFQLHGSHNALSPADKMVNCDQFVNLSSLNNRREQIQSRLMIACGRWSRLRAHEGRNSCRCQTQCFLQERWNWLDLGPCRERGRRLVPCCGQSRPSPAELP